MRYKRERERERESSNLIAKFLSLSLSLSLASMFLPSTLSFAYESNSLADELDIPPIIMESDDVEQSGVEPAIDIDMSSPNDSSDNVNTDMTLQYIEDVTDDKPDYDEEDPNVGPGSDDSIKYAVPTVLPMAFKTGGDLVCARGNAYKIDNLGKVTLNMNDVMVSPADGFAFNPEDEENITGSDTTLKLGFSSAAGTNPIAYSETSAIFPNSTKTHSYTLNSDIPVTVNDLAFAFGGKVLNKDIAVSDFMGSNAPKDAGNIIWTISTNKVDNAKAQEYKAEYDAATGDKGKVDDVYWYVDNGILKMAPVDGDSGTLINPGGAFARAATCEMPWTRSLYSSVVIEPGVSVAGSASHMFETLDVYKEEEEEEEESPNHDFGEVNWLPDSNYQNIINPTSIDTDNAAVTIDVSNLNTQDVTDMSYMFAGIDVDPRCGRPTPAVPHIRNYNITIDGLNTLDVSNVRSMEGMFQYLGYETLPLPASWSNSSKLVNMKDMFRGCWNLKHIDNLSTLDTTHVENISGLFSKLPHLDEINISELRTPSVKDMSRLFSYYNGEELAIPSTWNFDKVETISRIFEGCMNLNSIDYGSAWNTSNVKDMSYLYSARATLTNDIGIDRDNIDFLQLDTEYDMSSMENIEGLFSGYQGFSLTIPENFNTSKVTNMSKLFYKCYDLTEINFNANWTTASVVDASSMFEDCSSIQKFDLSGWDVRNLRMAQYMFLLKAGSEYEWAAHPATCTEIDLTGWQTDNLESTESMFERQAKLKSIKGIEMLNTSKVSDMSWTFSNCRSLVELDLSSWTTDKVRNASIMFNECISLEKLTLGSGWGDFTSLGQESIFHIGYTGGSPSRMFSRCEKLELNCSAWKIPDKFFTANNNTEIPGFNYEAPGVIPPTKKGL